MPLVMNKIYKITGNYTDAQKEYLINLIALFRNGVADDDPQANILNGKVQKYNDDKVIFYLNRAVKDLNSGVPRCNYDVFSFPEDDLLVEGAIVFALISEGILQLKNQVNFNDSGLSINLFDKTGGYQGWAGFLLQGYTNDKKVFKSTVLPMSAGSGFVGIGSEFSYGWW